VSYLKVLRIAEMMW